MNKLGQVLRAAREGLAPSATFFHNKTERAPSDRLFFYNETVEFEEE